MDDPGYTEKCSSVTIISPERKNRNKLKKDWKKGRVFLPGQNI